MSAEDRQEQQATIEAAKLQQKKELERRHKKAAQAAASLINNANPATNDHPYLKSKSIEAVPGLMVGSDNRLIVPMVSIDGEILSLQYIPPHGKEKRFLIGGQKGVFVIGPNTAPKLLYLAEGFATGATIHKATSAMVIVAFDCWNLKQVAIKARASR